MLHGGALVLKTSQCQRSWHKRVRLLSLPPCCKRRREGMAPVRKTEALRSQWVRFPSLAPVGSHDLVAMMSACLAECASSILAGTAIFFIDTAILLLTKYLQSETIQFNMKHLATIRNFTQGTAVEPRWGNRM